MGIAKQKKIIFLFLLVIFLFRPLTLIYNLRSNFFERGYQASFSHLKNLYYSSQYVKKDHPGIIPDQALEAFAGGIFLKGLNPILITHDQPPLGRYILSLSILLFDNPNTAVLVSMILSCVALFLISAELIDNPVMRVFPVGVFINEQLFLSKLFITPLLEPIQLPFILFSLYFFMKAVGSNKYKNWFILTSLMLGFVISTRYFVLGGGIVLGMLLYLMFSKNPNWKNPHHRVIN
jgi:hypothetical protein